MTEINDDHENHGRGDIRGADHQDSTMQRIEGTR